MQDSQVITGKFLGAMNTETVGQNGFLVRKFYLDITTNPEWPNTPEFQLKGDKVNLVDHLQKGQTIQVKYNIDGRKFDNTDKGGKKGVITNLNAWKIDVVQMQSAAVAPAPARPAAAPAPVPAMSGPGQYSSPAPAGFNNQDENNDLPF
jgi:hypothetical protein